jgi:HTH-type transcriptional regulator/antitoxin HigA
MTSEPKIIRTDEQYHSYLDEVERLMVRGDTLSSLDINRLEVLTVLIESYENSKYSIDPPDPIDAILFRMQEKGLKQADLIPYFGTSSRVSEVLNRRRPLTVPMIRALAVGLGISADTLIGLSDVSDTSPKEIDWSRFPIKEMMSRGWIASVTGRASSVEEIVRTYISGAGLQLGNAAFRRSLSGEATSPTSQYALYAWLARVIQRARIESKPRHRFDRSLFSASLLRELAQMSWSDRGPLLAIEFLQRNGVAVVIEPQLKGTQLDGAALQDADGMPIVGLTLRFDRLDSFWFTLLHEVVHIWKHIGDDREAFVDDINASSEDRREAEANRLAREAFIPRMLWRRSDAYLSPSKSSIETLARELRIHPAIIVGQLHRELGNYSVFNDMIGNRQVKRLFYNDGD